VLIGALSWGMAGLFDENVVSNVFGMDTFTDVLCVVVGLCGLMRVPRLLDGFRVGGDAANPRGT